MTSTKTDTAAALRHCVFRDLMFLLPAASFTQTEEFVANLALSRPAFFQTTTRGRDSETHRVLQRFLFLKVSPDLATVRPPLHIREIELQLADKYGDRLAKIAGFYRQNGGRWQLNLPHGCALYFYRSELGFYNGVLCQPLGVKDRFFLLSSSGQAGQSAMRLTASDREYFERFKQATATRADAGIAADVAGYRWTGRRFREVRKEKPIA